MTRHNEIIKCAEKYQLHIQPQTISLNESGLDFQKLHLEKINME